MTATRVASLTRRPSNATCADCGGQALRRYSSTLGVVVCEDCAGAHLRFGAEPLRAQSAAPDAWVEHITDVGSGAAAAMLPRSWSRPRTEQGAASPGVNSSAARLQDRFVRAKYEHRLLTTRSSPPVPPDGETQWGAVEVMLSRAENGGTFGLKPCRAALRRGVLQVAAVVPESPADRWNAAQESDCLRLCPGDCIIAVNAITAQREDHCRGVLDQLVEQPQVFLSVRRPLRDGDRGYMVLLQAVYVLFNPAKLGDVCALLERNQGRERTLFNRICNKYAMVHDDWRDLLLCLHRHCKRAEDELTDLEFCLEQHRGDELAFLDNLCEKWLGDAETEPQENMHKVADVDTKAWPKLHLTLRRESPGAPLGIRHDRCALDQKGQLIVCELVPNSPAALAGVCPGDVIEHIGGTAAAEVALRNRGRATEPDAAASLEVELVLRRPPSLDTSAPTS